MDIFPDFKGYLQGLARSNNTIRSYLNDLALFNAWWIRQNGEGMTPEKITPIDCKNYKNNLLAAGCKPATVNRRLVSIRSFCEWAITAGLIRDNPVITRPVPEQRLSPGWLDKREQYSFIRQAQREATDPQGIRNLAAVTLMLNTGVRLAELTALQPGDITLNDRSGTAVIRSGKGGKYRKVPLNREVRRTLKGWLAVRPGDLSTLFGILPRGLETAVQGLGERARVRVTPHKLRHTCAKNLLDAGENITIVAALLGHGSLNTTQRYTVPGERDLETAVNRLDN